MHDTVDDSYIEISRRASTISCLQCFNIHRFEKYIPSFSSTNDVDGAPCQILEGGACSKECGWFVKMQFEWVQCRAL